MNESKYGMSSAFDMANRTKNTGYFNDNGIKDAGVINLVDRMIDEAVNLKASDIHIEPLDTELRIRFRIDGMLQTVQKLELQRHSAIISRIKIMSDLDIAEKRLPQDGRVEIIKNGRKIDLRISTMPTIRGEKAVVRILDKAGDFLELEKLHFTESNLRLYKNLYAAAHGIILVTGPTGSGKSTTLYATLSKLNVDESNIITIEDPVEYKLAGINQVAVNKKAGLTFANGLRSIVRQDPNIIMIGEIRDAETAKIAVQAALTGHLVLSTLHTNNAVGAVTRLADMGIEPFLLVSALRGVVAQRLVRCLCKHCREAYEAAETDLLYLGRQPDEKITLYRAKGCAYCNFTGYSGRMAVQEVLPLTQTMGGMILRGEEENKIAAAAKAAGFKELKEDGIAKVLAGHTAIEELLRAAAY